MRSNKNHSLHTFIKVSYSLVMVLIAYQSLAWFLNIP